MSFRVDRIKVSAHVIGGVVYPECGEVVDSVISDMDRISFIIRKYLVCITIKVKPMNPPEEMILEF